MRKEHWKKNHIFNIFAQNIDEAVLTSTHKLCFGAKTRKIVYPCKPQFYYMYIKVEYKWVYIINGQVFLLEVQIKPPFCKTFSLLFWEIFGTNEIGKIIAQFLGNK